MKAGKEPMKNKRFHFLLVAFALFLSACSTQSQTVTDSTAQSSVSESRTSENTSDTLQKIKDAGEIVVATPGTLFPTSYYNSDKQLVGYEIDMMDEIGKRLGVNVRYVEIGVESAFTAVQNGQVDVALNNFDITAARLEKFNFSVPYKYSIGGIIVRADGSSNIHSLEDWMGKKAAGGANTQYMKIAEKLGAETVIYDNSTNDVYLRDVANGRTDFIPNDYYTQKVAVAFFSDIPVTVSEEVKYNPTQQGIVMRKGDDSLTVALDDIIEQLRADGTLRAISEKYYKGQDLSVPLTDVENIPVVEVD